MYTHIYMSHEYMKVIYLYLYLYMTYRQTKEGVCMRVCMSDKGIYITELV